MLSYETTTHPILTQTVVSLNTSYAENEIDGVGDIKGMMLDKQGQKGDENRDPPAACKIFQKISFILSHPLPSYPILPKTSLLKNLEFLIE